MTIYVTPGTLLALGFALGAIFGGIVTAYVFYMKIRRAFTILRLGVETVKLHLLERVPQLTTLLGTMGVSAAIVNMTTDAVNQLTRGVGRKIKTRTTRPIGFRSDTTKEHDDGR